MFTVNHFIRKTTHFNEVTVLNVPTTTTTLTWMCLERYDREACRNVSSILSVISISGGQLNIQCKSTMLQSSVQAVDCTGTNKHTHYNQEEMYKHQPRDKNWLQLRDKTTQLRFVNKFPRLCSRTEKYLFPMLCLTIKLHKH